MILSSISETLDTYIIFSAVVLTVIINMLAILIWAVSLYRRTLTIFFLAIRQFWSVSDKYNKSRLLTLFRWLNSSFSTHLKKWTSQGTSSNEELLVVISESMKMWIPVILWATWNISKFLLFNNTRRLPN